MKKLQLKVTVLGPSRMHEKAIAAPIQRMHEKA